METKTLLSLIKEDVSHLQGITSEYNLALPPAAEEVELALVRARTLVRQLELLHKSLSTCNIQPINLAPVPEIREQGPEITPLKHQQAVWINEPVEKISSPEPQLKETPISPLVMEEPVPELSVTIEEVVIPDLSEVVIAVLPELIVPFNEESKAQEITEIELKNQNDATGETQRMVNDLLLQEKSESGYPIIPINHLRDGIGINDRFLFVRELFENDSAKFESSITALDNLPTIHEAVNYMKMNFKWHKSEASQKFLALVKRRFTN